MVLEGLLPWICPETSMRPTRIELATFGLKGCGLAGRRATYQANNRRAAVLM